MCQIDVCWRPSSSCCARAANGRRWMRLILARAAHRRFQEWVRAGLFYRLWRVAARRYDEVRGLDWRWISVDGCLPRRPCRAVRWSGATRPTAANRA
jgi:transposase